MNMTIITIMTVMKLMIIRIIIIIKMMIVMAHSKLEYHFKPIAIPVISMSR